MKKITITLSAILVLMFTIVSCGSDDNNGGTQTITPMSAAINGQQFLPTAVPSAQTFNSNRFIVISGTNTNSSATLTLNLGTSSGTADEIMVGSYAINGTDNTSISYFDGNNSFQTDNNGQIVITALDSQAQKISGSFEGVATGSFGSNTTYTITNGAFNEVSYTVQ